jgi:hypothetical protein
MNHIIYRNKETEVTIDENGEVTITKINCENTITLTISEAINIANGIRKYIIDNID